MELLNTADLTQIRGGSKRGQGGTATSQRSVPCQPTLYEILGECNWASGMKI